MAAVSSTRRLRAAKCTKKKSTGRSYGSLDAHVNQSFRALHPPTGTPYTARRLIAAGTTRTLKVRLDEGRNLILCNVPGHFRRDMVMSFTVE